MPQLVIFDTDVLIDAGRRIDDAISCLQRTEQKATLGVSIITQMELMVGCRNKSEFRALERFLRRFQILGINENIGNTSVDLIRHYRLSHGLLIADALIAATALTTRVPFVTKNRRDYRFIEGLELLSYPKAFTSEEGFS